MRFLRDWLTGLASALAGLIRAPSPAVPVFKQDPIVKGAFRDRGRGRIIPFKLYAPSRSRGPSPVVIFSHGLGGSREGAPYLGRALAQRGYFAFFLQHPGSDEGILEGAQSADEVLRRLQEAMLATENAIDRFGDLPAVLDQLAVMNSKGRLAGRLDLNRVGMAGHSFGARGTMVAAGQRMGLLGGRFKEPRIKAGVALSPNVPSGNQQSLAGIYDAVDIPLLHVTGTNDGMPLEGTSFDPATRTLPFQLINRTDQYLLVLEGATHGTFSGRPTPGEPDIEPRHLQAVAEVVVLFFDAHLKGDPEALRTLREDFAHLLAPGDVFTVK